MRTLKSILVLGLALSTFTAAEAAKLTFKVTNPNEKVKVILTFSQSGEQKEVAIDAAGNGNIEITGFTPQYVSIACLLGVFPFEIRRMGFDELRKLPVPLSEGIP